MSMGNPNYNPDVFEYDDELDEGEMGERVILDEHGNEIDVIKTIGTRPKNHQGFNINTNEEFHNWGESDEDDAIIEAYLAS